MGRHGKSSERSSTALSRRKTWLFRLAASLGVPLAAFLVLELALRLGGFGHPTSFLLTDKIGGTGVFVSNRQFGWRFFGKQQARAPQTLAIPRKKAPGTIRVFVFGESAAFGDPQPDFGLPRMLQALLSERYPQTRFEVINAAMTAINSHVVLPIARDCARADGDIWVIYMGNNEVVGPFGAGTVFGSQAPPRAAIRANLALKASRTGQLLDAIVRSATKPPADKAEWGGMLMFMENQIRWGDARLAKMYQHFERNLGDIIQAGKRSGAGVVVSTVAVNLKDCAPFGSSLTASVSEVERAKWRDFFQHGVTAQAAARFEEALGWFRQAEDLAGDAAELQFRQGQCVLALGDAVKAQLFFNTARDLDTLRFRCDSQLNAITREIAGGRERERVVLVDAEAEFARQSPGGITGAEFFYEHVHLTFEGNYLLARSIAEAVAALLPESVRAQSETRGDWATAGQCARRLGWTDWTRQAALGEITGRLNDAPFTQQSDHAIQLDRIGQQMKSLMRAGQSALLHDAEARCAEAQKLSPDDPVLLARMAGLLESNAKLEEARGMAKRVTERLPNSPEAWNHLGVILARLNRNDEAAQMFRESLARDPDDVFTRNNLAQVLVRLNRKAEAKREYEAAIALKPAYATAHLGLGRLLEEMGRADEAGKHYTQARQHRVNRPADLAVLARFCVAKGWLAEAATNYALALQMNPSDASLWVEAGRCSSTLGRNDEARRHFAEAVALSPDSGEAHFLLGRELGRNRDDAGAAEQFQQAVRLMPDVVEAHLNLGVALMNLGQKDGALRELEEVLKRQPTNELALKYAAKLR